MSFCFMYCPSPYCLKIDESWENLKIKTHPPVHTSDLLRPISGQRWSRKHVNATNPCVISGA